MNPRHPPTLQHPDTFKKFDNLAPIVSAHANFDEVLVPADHVSRSPNDTYYVVSLTGTVPFAPHPASTAGR